MRLDVSTLARIDAYHGRETRRVKRATRRTRRTDHARRMHILDRELFFSTEHS